MAICPISFPFFPHLSAAKILIVTNSTIQFHFLSKPSQSKHSAMQMSIFLILLFFLEFLASAVGRDHEYCKQKKCDNSSLGPSIRFPFRLKDNHLHDCSGYLGFDLSCSENGTTILELPFSVKLAIKEIDYQSQLIYAHSPDACLPQLLLNLNLSTSPFHYATHRINNYTFFSCSPSNPDADKYGRDVTCLGDSSQKIYAVSSDFPMFFESFLSCKKMYSISSIPAASLYQTTQDLRLKWSKPTCQICEVKNKYCRFKNNRSTDLETECFDIQKSPPTTDVLRGLVLLAIVLLAIYCAVRLIKTKKEDQLRIDRFLEDYRALKPARYSYADIKNITSKFKEKIGQGGYGTVYKGKLSNDVHVAVKILNTVKGNGDEFIREVGTIGRIHHTNVVRLVGFCAEGFRRALLYEFLPNHSLEKFISSHHKKQALGWEKLKDIALGIAKGIKYLHQGCDQRIIHFDIKPHNILLDHKFNPKISDFGLAKLCSKQQSAVSMTAARGTVGYIAPEVFSRNFGNVSCKSDIYSFGMLLLDMVGVRNSNATQNTSEVYFPQWIYNGLERGEELEIEIEEDRDAKIAKKLTIVGLWCIQWYPVDRPSIEVVVQILEGDGGTLTLPPSPFASANPMTTRGRMGARPFNSEFEIISESE